MTREECIIKISQIEEDYRKTKRDAEKKKTHDIAVTLNAWAKDNSRYNIGDIIESQGIIIMIDGILGYRSLLANYNNIYCVYKGHALTKRLQPRKDGWVTTIYDDGGREIKVLKKAKEE